MSTSLLSPHLCNVYPQSQIAKFIGITKRLNIWQSKWPHAPLLCIYLINSHWVSWVCPSSPICGSLVDLKGAEWLVMPVPGSDDHPQPGCSSTVARAPRPRLTFRCRLTILCHLPLDFQYLLTRRFILTFWSSWRCKASVYSAATAWSFSLPTSGS